MTRSVKIIIYNKGQAVFGLSSIHTFLYHSVFVIYGAFHYITNSYICHLITMHTFQFLGKKCCELLYCLSCHTLEKSIEIIEMRLRIILRIVIFNYFLFYSLNLVMVMGKLPLIFVHATRLMPVTKMAILTFRSLIQWQRRNFTNLLVSWWLFSDRIMVFTEICSDL